MFQHNILFSRLYSAFPVSQWPTFVYEHSLNAYSGGTVRDSHPIPYSFSKAIGYHLLRLGEHSNIFDFSHKTLAQRKHVVNVFRLLFTE